jgi:hypothetical protein
LTECQLDAPAAGRIVAVGGNRARGGLIAARSWCTSFEQIGPL